MPFIKILIFFIFFSLLGCNSHTAQEYIENGKSFYQQENYDKAKLEFKNAVQIDNQQAEAFYYLALIYEKEKNGTEMYKTLEQVVEIDPNHIEAHLKLGMLFLISQKIDEAMGKVNLILAIDKNNLDALVLQAKIFFTQEKINEAISIIDKVLLHNPNHADAAKLQVVIYLQQKNYSTALKTVNQALKNNIDDLALNQLKIKIFSELKDFSAIEKQYKIAIKRFPETLAFSYNFANYYFRRQKDDEGVEILENIIVTNQDLLAPKIRLIRFLITKKPTLVEEKIKGYIAKTPKETELYFYLVKLYSIQKKPLEAKKQLNLLIKNTDNESAQLKAKLLLAANEPDSTVASALIEEVLAVNPQNLGGRILKTQLKLAKGLYDEGIIDLRSILKNYPESDEAITLLAQAYLEKNSLALAEEYFRKALDLNPSNFTAMTFVASKMIDNEDFIRAEKIVQRFLKEDPENPKALLTLAKIKFSQEDWEGTEKIVELIAKNPKGVDASNYLAGRISQRQEFFEKAIEQYKQALKYSPNLFAALDGMLICYERLNQRTIMHTYLNEYIATYPDKPYAIVLRAQLFIFDKKIDQALSILITANHKWPKIAAFYEKITAIYKLKNNDDKAISMYKEGLKNIPNNINLIMGLAGIYEKNKDYKTSLAIYEELLANQPENNIALNNLASLLVDHFPSKENAKRALELVKHFADLKQIYYLDTYGWVLFANSHYQEALAVFIKVVSEKPNTAVFRYHLAKAYIKINNPLKAIPELKTALKISDKKEGFAEKDEVITLLKTLKN